MVIVLKYNVLYVVRQGMRQEMNDVHYETYIDIDHQMATENEILVIIMPVVYHQETAKEQNKMYINNNSQLAGADLHQGLLRLQPEAEVDTIENESVVERRGDLRTWTYPCVMAMFPKMMKKRNWRMKHRLLDLQHWRLRNRSAMLRTT